MARENPLLLTTEEAADLMGLHPATVRRLIERDGGTLYGVRVLRLGPSERAIRIPRGKLLEALGATDKR